jgi:hypothetical protein
VRVRHQLGDPDGVLRVHRGLGESAEMREREGEPGAGPGGEKRRQRGSPAVVGERLCHILEECAGLHQGSNREVCLGKPVRGFDCEVRVLQLAGDVERLAARLQRTGMLAEVPQSRADVRHHEPQPAPIADLPRERLGFAHAIEDLAVLPERSQGSPRVEAEVDALDLGLTRVGQVRERAERILEMAARLGVPASASGHARHPSARAPPPPPRGPSRGPTRVT